MKEAGEVLTSSNGIAIAVIFILAVILLLLLARLGYFSFKGKGLTVGKTENEVRSTLLKQKEFLLQYCSYLSQSMMSDLVKKRIEITYINIDYVVEKTVDEWLGWLLVNHITEEESYIKLKTQQTKLIMLKAVGRVNPELLQNEELVNYFNSLCDKTTKEIIKGILTVYKTERIEK